MARTDELTSWGYPLKCEREQQFVPSKRSAGLTRDQYAGMRTKQMVLLKHNMIQRGLHGFRRVQQRLQQIILSLVPVVRDRCGLAVHLQGNTP